MISLRTITEILLIKINVLVVMLTADLLGFVTDVINQLKPAVSVVRFMAQNIAYLQVLLWVISMTYFIHKYIIFIKLQRKRKHK